MVWSKKKKKRRKKRKKEKNQPLRTWIGGHKKTLKKLDWEMWLRYKTPRVSLIMGAVIKALLEPGGLPRGLSGKGSACRQERWVQSLSQEDLLEKKRATSSSILTWKIPQTEELGRLLGSQKSWRRFID